jgi:hypothetical protein
MESLEKTTKPFPTKMSLEKGKTYDFCGCEYSKVFKIMILKNPEPTFL